MHVGSDSPLPSARAVTWPLRQLARSCERLQGREYLGLNGVVLLRPMRSPQRGDRLRRADATESPRRVAAHHRMAVEAKTLAQCADRRPVERVAQRYCRVAPQHRGSAPTHGGLPIAALERPAAQMQHLDQRWTRGTGIARRPLAAGARWRRRRRRTGELTEIAPPNPVADERPHRAWYRVGPLGEIGDAAIGIDRVVAAQRSRGTCVDAAGARAARFS